MKWNATIKVCAVVLGAFAAASPAAAQFTRVTELPASAIFSVRATGDTIVAGSDTSVFVSTDAGTSWKLSTRLSPAAKTISAVRMLNRRLYAGTFGQGVFVSDDLGSTWHAFNEGLVGGFLDSQLDVSEFEVRGDSLYVGTEGAGVYVRRLSPAGTWSPFGSAFEPNQAANVSSLALGGTRLMASAGSNGTVFVRDPADAEWAVSDLANTRLLAGVQAEAAAFTGSSWVVGTSIRGFHSVLGPAPWT